MSTIEIPLSNGGIAIIDAVDAPLISGHKWKAHYRPGGPIGVGYVTYMEGGKRLWTSLHRLLTNPADDMVVDHINGDVFDNRRSNLRICSQTQNSRNRKKHKNNRSGFKGIYLDNSAVRRGGMKVWRAQIRVDGKKILLGSHITPESAHAAYARAAQKYHGEFARVS